MSLSGENAAGARAEFLATMKSVATTGLMDLADQGDAEGDRA
jgi:hypothetical protein